MQFKFESNTLSPRSCAEPGDQGVILSSGRRDGCTLIITPLIGFSGLMSSVKSSINSQV